MKNILTLIMLLICTALILASCADSDLSVTVTENGGRIAYEYYVDKEIADEYFNSELPDGLKACQIDEIDGRLCYVYSESFTAQSFTELENKLCKQYKPRAYRKSIRYRGYKGYSSDTRRRS